MGEYSKTYQRIPPSVISLSPKSQVIHHKSEITSPNVTSHWSIVGFHKNMISISQTIYSSKFAIHSCFKFAPKLAQSHKSLVGCVIISQKSTGLPLLPYTIGHSYYSNIRSLSSHVPNSTVPISVNITRDWGHYIPHH